MDRPRKKRKTNIGKAVTAQSRSTFVMDTNNFCPVTRLTRTLAQRLLGGQSIAALSRSRSGAVLAFEYVGGARRWRRRGNQTRE